MSKYTVTAVVVDLTTIPPTISPVRDEVVDTAANSLFADCATIRDVEHRYEDFWNYLNSEDEVHRLTEKVKVLSVVRIAGDVPAEGVSDIKLRLMESRVDG